MERRIELTRVPLFLPALCAGLGCWVGGFFALPVPLLGGIALLAFALWIIPQRLAPIAFYLFCAVAAALFLRLPEVYPDPRELTSLPDAKFGNPVWEGRIVSVPELFKGHGSVQARFVVRVDRWKALDDWAPAKGRMEVEVKGTDDSWQPGQRVRLAGPLSLPPLPDAPGRFDTRAFLAHQGIPYQMIVLHEDVTRLSAGNGILAAFAHGAAAVREWGIDQLSKGLESDPLAGQVLAGIVLGQRHLVPPATLFAFRTAGAYHLFSANGGDVALLLGVALAALRLCGLIRWRWGWLAAPILLFYALVAGSQPSVLRGLTAATIVLAAWMVGRPMPALHLWSLTLLAILGISPRSALDLGFQFSFIVVLAMILLTPFFASIFSRPLALDPFIPPRLATKPQKLRFQGNRFASRLLAACTAAWLGAIGLELAYFHQFCLTTIPANFIGVPLTGIIFTIGLLTLAGAALGTLWPILLNNANWLFVKLLLGAVLLFSHVPYASVYLPLGKSAPGPEPEFTLATAGRGSMLLLRHAGRDWLIDPGNEYAFFHDTDPTRKYLGVNRLAGFIATEWSSTAAGVAPLLPRLVRSGPAFAPPPGTLSHAGPWAAAWQQSKAAPLVWKAGDRFDFGEGLIVEVLSPDPSASASRVAADRGLVLRFDYHGARLLYAGNVGFGIEEQLMARTPSLQSAVLIEGRHPTDANMTPEWLARVAPENLILIGTGNESGWHRNPLDEANAAPKSWDLQETGALRITLHQDGRTEVVPWQTTSRSP